MNLAITIDNRITTGTERFFEGNFFVQLITVLVKPDNLELICALYSAAIWLDIAQLEF